MTEVGRNRPEADKLSVRRYLHSGVLIVEALGTVTLGTLDALAEALRPDTESGALRLTVDLRRVDFLDSSGLSLLVEASKRLRSHETPRAPRVLVMPGRQPERILRLGGFDTILEIAHDLGGMDMG